MLTINQAGHGCCPHGRIPPALSRAIRVPISLPSRLSPLNGIRSSCGRECLENDLNWNGAAAAPIIFLTSTTGMWHPVETMKQVLVFLLLAAGALAGDRSHDRAVLFSAFLTRTTVSTIGRIGQYLSLYHRFGLRDDQATGQVSQAAGRRCVGAPLSCKGAHRADPILGAARLDGF